MLPVVAIVGRPNVGKSTLFNCLTGRRDALVADRPGLTRDRNYGLSRTGANRFLVVDTGGLDAGRDEISLRIGRQAEQAIAQADCIVLVADARTGLTPSDIEIAHRLRRREKPIALVVNKTDGLDPDVACADFHALNLGEPLPIAAAHGRGIQRLIDAVAGHVATDASQPSPAEDATVKVAIVGRPNAGKSTLVNRLLGYERVVTHETPGTTRDSIEVPFEHAGRHYTLIDTAGIRRRARVSDVVEKFSIIKSLQAIDAAGVVLLMTDARVGTTDQDATLLGLILDAGRALVIAVNKWDGLEADRRRRIREQMERKFAFVDYARIHYLSAREGTGVGGLFRSVDRAWESASRKLPTPLLTRILADAVVRHPPPLAQGKRIKLRYAHQGGVKPPRIVIHGNRTDAVPDAFKRYLARAFRTALDLEGTPIRLEFRRGENPFQGRKNLLTRRQARKRRRLREHAKRRR